MRRLLILRPEPGASATVEKARAMGLDAFVVPLFTVEPVDWQPPEPSAFDGLLLTSANTLRHGGNQLTELRGLPVYAVGETTAEAAREAGFEIKATGDAGVDRLLDSIEPDLRLLHLCGADRLEPAGARQKVTSLVAYRSVELANPDLSTAGDGVALVHSPRAGARFAELVRDRRAIGIVAISKAAADAAGDGWEAVEVAADPTDEALLALAARLCNNSAPE